MVGCSCVLFLSLYRSPDTSKIKQKMLYASSKDALRKKLVGIATEIQATDLSEITYDVVFDKVSKQVNHLLFFNISSSNGILINTRESTLPPFFFYFTLQLIFGRFHLRVVIGGKW